VQGECARGYIVAHSHKQPPAGLEKATRMRVGTGSLPVIHSTYSDTRSCHTEILWGPVSPKVMAQWGNTDPKQLIHRAEQPLTREGRWLCAL
jgi:hypothetical protein